MPKLIEPKPSPWRVETKGDLAKRLGIGRNAPSAWQQLDAKPAPGELCEFQWRVWGEANGRRFSDTGDRSLVEQLAAAGVERYRLQLAAMQSTTPAPTTEAQQQAVTLNPNGGLDEQRRVQTYIANQERLQALQMKSRKLIGQADVLLSIEAIGRVCDQLLRDVAEWSTEFATTVPEQTRLKVFLNERLEVGRQAVKQKTLDELKKLVEPHE